MENLERIGYVVLILGIGLIGLGNYYPNMFSAESRWSAEANDEYETIRLRYHNLAFKAAKAIGTPEEEKVQKELEEAEAEYERVHSNLMYAIEGPSTAGKYLYWIGVAAMGLGALTILANRKD